MSGTSYSGSMTQKFGLRNVLVHARPQPLPPGTVAPPPIWSARLVCGLLNAKGYRDPTDFGGDQYRAATLRVAAQDRALSSLDGINPNRHLHRPLLLEAGLRPGGYIDANFDHNGDPAPTVWPNTPNRNWLLFAPSATSALLSTGAIAMVPRNSGAELEAGVFAEVLVSLDEALGFVPPPQNDPGQGEIWLPAMTLQQGEIPVLLDIDVTGSSPLFDWLQVHPLTTATDIAAGSAWLFTENSGIAVATQWRDGRQALAAVLVPDGIRFKAQVAMPFAVPGEASPAAPVSMQLLLTRWPDTGVYCLRPAPLQDDTLSTRLAEGFSTYLGSFSRQGVGGTLAFQANPQRAPFAWLVGSGKLAFDRAAGTLLLDTAPDRLRVVLETTAAPGTDIPATCLLHLHDGAIRLGAAATLTLRGGPAGPTAAQLATAGQLTLIWATDTDTPQCDLRGGRLDLPRLRAACVARYSAAGALAANSAAQPFLFLPLERGMVQIPLPPPSPQPRAATGLAPPPGLAVLQAFSGFVAVDFAANAPMPQFQLGLTAAARVIVTATRALPGHQPGLKVAFTSPFGSVQGLLYAAAATPSAAAILPSLSAGPVSCQPLDILIDDEADPMVSITIDATGIAGPQLTLGLKALAAAGAAGTTAAEILVWLAHDRMALVSTMPMTQTVATRAPSSTRDLVPFALDATAPSTLILRYGGALPRLSIPSSLAFRVPQSLHWLWPVGAPSGVGGAAQDGPALECLGPGQKFSGTEPAANIALVPMSLPDVEIRLLPPDAGCGFDSMLGSIRYDLAILTELWLVLASVAIPGSATTAPEPAATALNLPALDKAWLRAALNAGLTRTVNDRMTPFQNFGVSSSPLIVDTLVEPRPITTSLTLATTIGPNAATALPIGGYSLFQEYFDAAQHLPWASSPDHPGTPFFAGGTALAGASWFFDRGTPTSATTALAVAVTGYAVEPYHSAGFADIWFDARGSGLRAVPQAALPIDSATLPAILPAILRRAVKQTGQLGAVPEERFLLTLPDWHATLQDMVAGAAVPQELGLRLRDLPMAFDATAQTYSFDATTPGTGGAFTLTGLEGELGPRNAAMIGGDSAACSYEWALFDWNKQGGFAFSLSGFLVRPLRLVRFVVNATASPATAEELWIIANLELPSTGQDMADAPYATGSPVLLVFGFEAGVAKLVKIGSAWVDFQSGKEATIQFNPNLSPKRSFALAPGLIYDTQPAQVPIGEPVPMPIGLDLTFVAGATGEPAIQITSAQLRATLFGSKISLAMAPFFAPGLCFCWQENPDPAHALVALRVAAVTVTLGGQPCLTLDVRLNVPAPNGGALVSLTAQNMPGKISPTTLGWFGVTTYLTEALGIDHARGLVTLTASAQTAEPGANFLQDWPLLPAATGPTISCAGEWAVAPQSVTAAPEAVRKIINGLVAPPVGVNCTTAAALIFELGAAAFGMVCSSGDSSLRVRHDATLAKAATASTGWDHAISVSRGAGAVTSAIGWPMVAEPAALAPDAFFVDGAASAFFAANPDDADAWRTAPGWGPADIIAAHTIDYRMVEAPLAASLLNVDAPGIVHLIGPWQFPALTIHTLTTPALPAASGRAAPAPKFTAQWTAIDQVNIWHSTGLLQMAQKLANDPGQELGFLARYLAGMVAGGPWDLANFAAAPGFFSASLARTVWPPELLAILVQAARAPTGYVVSGGALLDIAAPDPALAARGLGFRVMTPWLATLGSGSLGGLNAIPQAPGAGAIDLKVSPYDLAAGLPRAVDVTAARSIGRAERSVSALLRLGPDDGPQDAEFWEFDPVSQAVIGDLKQKEREGGTLALLQRPIWLRAIAAWSAIRRQAISAGPGQIDLTAVTLVPYALPRGGYGLAKFDAGQPEALSDASAATDIVQAAAAPWRILTEVALLSMPADPRLAALFTSDGEDDGTLARRVQAVLQQQPPVTPKPALAALLWGGSGVPVAVALRNVAPARQRATLRDRSATIYPSASLAWPWASARPTGAGSAAIVIGPARNLQDSAFGVSGMTEIFGMPHYAGAMDDPATTALVGLFSAEKTIFRRRSGATPVAPPDRALIALPGRVRAPTGAALRDALQTAQPDLALAPILPAQIERISFGGRVGVMGLRALMLDMVPAGTTADALDPQLTRFGRRADTGPAVFRQLRSPRATALPSPATNVGWSEILAATRRSLVGTDLAEQIGTATPQITYAPHPFLGVLGPMAITGIYEDGNADLLATLAVRVEMRAADKTALPCLAAAAPPDHFVLQAGITAYGKPATPPTAPPLPTQAYLPLETCFVLTIDTSVIRLQQNEVTAGVTTSPFSWDCYTLAVMPADAPLLAQALTSVTPDSTATFTVVLPRQPNRSYVNPVATVPGATVQGPPIQAGLRVTLSMPIPLGPATPPMLALPIACVAFRDPAYDRQLSSLTNSQAAAQGNQQFLLAFDRASYNPRDPIMFALGPWCNSPTGGPAWVGGNATTTWKFSLRLIRADDTGSPGAATNLYLWPSAQVLPDFSATSTPQSRTAQMWLDGFQQAMVGTQKTAYMLALSEFVLADLNQDVPQPQPLAIQQNDTLLVTAIVGGTTSLSVTLRMTLQASISPPPGVYGLIGLEPTGNRDGGARLTSSLFATAPLPQNIEFPDIVDDLAAGTVRRRAVFLWNFAPGSTDFRAALIKIDRSGGGQLPNAIEDFQDFLT